MFSEWWLMADMDGTLTPTPTKGGGQYLDLTRSACLPLLQRFLDSGGNVCAVSTAGRRMWRQLFDVLSPTIFKHPGCGTLAICGFSGAALFFSNWDTKTMVEDSSYRRTAIPGGTGIHEGSLKEAKTMCTQLLHQFFETALSDSTLIPMLSKKYHAPYEALLQRRRELGKELFETQCLGDADLCKHGAYLKETNDALLDLQWVPGVEPLLIVQISLLGIPMARYHEFFTKEVEQRFLCLGLRAKSQPNSVVIAPDGVDKATCVSWFRDHVHGFRLDHSFAIGDNPMTIDKPLRLFPSMPFISVSPNAPSRDEMDVLYYGGVEEDGTARFMAELLDLASPDDWANCNATQLLEKVKYLTAHV